MKKFQIKKWAGITLATVMLLQANVLAKAFPDVQQGYSWAKPAIEKLSDRGVINGYTDGKYYPEKYVSFEETMQLLYGLSNPSTSEVSEARARYERIAKDNGVNNWAISAVSYALSKGVITESTLIKGKNANWFSDRDDRGYPNRAEISTYFAKALGFKGNGDINLLKHVDVNSIPNDVKGYLADLVKAGVFTSTGSSGRFEGDRGIRRAEMAIITDKSYDFKDLSKREKKTAEGQVVIMSTSGVEIVSISVGNKVETFEYNDLTKFVKNGRDIKASEIQQNMNVKITYVEQTTTSGAKGLATEIEVKGAKEYKYLGYVDRYFDDNYVTISYEEVKNDTDFTKQNKFYTSKRDNFKFDRNIKITKLGSPIKAKDIKESDLVEFNIEETNLIKELVVYPEKGQVRGTLINKVTPTYVKSGQITLKLDDGKEYAFALKYENMDKKDGQGVRGYFDNLKVGEKIDLTLGYKNIISFGKESDSSVYGEVSSIRLPERTYNSVYDGYVEIKNQRRDFRLTKDTKFLDSSGRNVTSDVLEGRITALYQKGTNVVLEMSGNNVVSIRPYDMAKNLGNNEFRALVTVDNSYSNQGLLGVRVSNLQIGKEMQNPDAYDVMNLNILERYRGETVIIEGKVWNEPTYGYKGRLEITNVPIR